MTAGTAAETHRPRGAANPVPVLGAKSARLDPSFALLADDRISTLASQAPGLLPAGMKPLPLLFRFGMLAALLGCASGLRAADPAPVTQNKKGAFVVVVNATIKGAHDAALQVLTGIGCEIKKDAADAIEGHRSHKMGLVVGSGGETVIVALKDAGDGKTEVTVDTKKSLFGIAGQKNWSEQVATQIRDTAK